MFFQRDYHRGGGEEKFCNLKKQVDIKHNLNYDVIPSGMEET
jgi:hypothetical protein